ncbi:MAG TPA: hypothetical protein VH144_02645 [Candidatus Saccharimonadales bacterium]|nr:hypothetical protein [Candidatus Saccharimonadales bacterium]
MKDIDFDELDKAVSSLLGSKDEKPAVSDTPTSTAAVPTASTIPVTAPSRPVEPPSPRSTPAIVTSPAAHRSGRFMDVVHPSSDMGQTDKEPAPQAMAGSGRKLQPISRDVKPDPIEPKETPQKADDPVPQKLSSVADPDPQTLISTQDTADTVWPDPLDVQLPKEPVTATDDQPAAISPEPKMTDDNINELAELKTSTDTPSPFLSDTKVEKRPLGAYADQPKPDAPTPPETPEESTPAPSSPESLFDQPDTPLLAADDTQVPATPAAPSTEDMPPELDQKVVEVEATERGDDKPIEPTTAANVGSMSIPQQYKAAERPTKETERPPFDTKDYHAPIPTPERKKAGIGQWILLGLLLVAALGGAAYWYLYLR